MRLLVGRVFAYYFDIATPKAPASEGALGAVQNRK